MVAYHELETIIGFGFCDIRYNQGLGKCNQPKPSASADYTCRDLDYSGYHKNRIQLLFYYTLFYGRCSRERSLINTNAVRWDGRTKHCML